MGSRSSAFTFLQLETKPLPKRHQHADTNSQRSLRLGVVSAPLKQMHEQNMPPINSVWLCPEACLFSSLFSLSPGLHALHAEDETPGEVKRGAGMEFCSIYPPEIFL